MPRSHYTYNIQLQSLTRFQPTESGVTSRLTIDVQSVWIAITVPRVKYVVREGPSTFAADALIGCRVIGGIVSGTNRRFGTPQAHMQTQIIIIIIIHRKWTHAGSTGLKPGKKRQELQKLISQLRKEPDPPCPHHPYLPSYHHLHPTPAACRLQSLSSHTCPTRSL